MHTYSELDKIDVGVYIVPIRELPSRRFKASLTFDKVIKYLSYLRSAIKVPIWVIGMLP